MNCRGQRIASLVAFALALAASSWSAPRAVDAVRGDWYLRESLAAIRDWEPILERWEKAIPEAERTPVFPVPSNGDVVEWPNPIPRMLLPDGDGDTTVRLRIAGDKVSVEHVAADGKVEQAAVAPNAVTVGYKHPGGGGKDRWYHRYHRRFDGLATFRPRPAPFALGLEGPLDLRRGPNELRVAFRNVTDKPLELTASLRFHSREGDRSCGERSVALAPGATQLAPFSVELGAEGGGLLVLSVGGAGGSFWVPLLTHVEDVASVLLGIEQILTDAPDPVAAERLAALRRGQGDWRARFEAASALRDELLLRRIDFDALLFVKRKPFDSEQPFMDAHHCVNRPGGSIWRLAPVLPTGKVTPVVDSLGEGIYRDLCLHWDADRLLFAFGNGSDRGPRTPGKGHYDLHEVRVDGSGLRQLTSSPKSECEPFYLPNGQIGFTSDLSEHYVMCGSNIHAPTLFVMEADGSGVRQLSFNCFNDLNPAVMPDGRILYTRWEYNERSVTSLHNPFTIHPDGTMMSPYYGNATFRPNVVMFPRPVPGSHKVMALFTGHHGQTHGPISLIDVRRGRDGPAPLTVLTPGVPTTGERHEDSLHGWFSDPVPLSETTYLCSYTPTVVPWLERSWALYVGDRHGNLALVYRDPAISCAEPVPLVRRRRPHVLLPAAPDTHATDAEATLALLDAHIGLPGVPRGTPRQLRILEDVPRKGVPEGGVICTSGTPIYTVKRIFGTVPVETDGSAHFVVPANRNVYFEVLDERGREIQRMRSVVCLKPGERQTCIGCHEPRTTSPPNLLASALRRAPSRPQPPPWGTATLSFLRDVQPLLNARCVRCHTHDRAANGVVLTDDLTDQFTVGYQELLPYLSVANAMRWDHSDDVDPRPPGTYGSKVSHLTRLLEEGHHDVKLTEEDWQRLFVWIDANGVYYDTYETGHYPNRHIFGEAGNAMNEVHGRRCARCHAKGDGRGDTWWLSLNRRDPKLSRALAAPLARSAGGWGRCDGTVFAATTDPDYEKLLAALTALHGKLAEHPREDLLSLRGTEAERQKVELPPPPPPRPKPKDELPDGWVYLSDLDWEKGTAGWTHNKDGLPRRDRDVEDKPLRLARNQYRKGIGTHAPSEIVYHLDGKYERFHAVVGAAEAGGTVVFQVFADDKKVYESGVMHGLRDAKEVDLPVAGVQRLRLVVTIAGDNHTADMANWADARLLRAPARRNR